MKIEIRTRGLELGPDDGERTRRRLRLAIGRFAEQVKRVSITLEDLSDSQGESGQRCRIRLSLRAGGEPILAEGADRDLLTAAEGAAKRLGRSVALRLQDGRRPTRSSQIF